MTTGFVAPTKGQKEEFKNMIDAAWEKAGLNKEATQRLIGNGGKFQEGVIALLAKLSALDDRFELLSAFKLTVPKDYDHDKQLATFKGKADIQRCNNNITDANFVKVTNKLVPGKTYLVKIFEIKTIVISEECLAFLDSQRWIPVGAQGVSLAQQLKKEQFPVLKWTVSFDEKGALWIDGDGDRRVPYVYRDSGGDWEFGLGLFGARWLDGCCLVCFCDLPAEQAGSSA